jgi:hypothetical protein
MFQKLGAITVGMGLVLAGWNLARQELKIFAAREVVRAARLDDPRLDLARIVRAIRELDAVQSPHDEVRLATLYLELARYERERVTPVPVETAPESLGRAERLGRAVASIAPLNAQTWCVLAEVTARKGALSEAALRFFDLCYDTAPFELWLMESRLQAGMAFSTLLPQGLMNKVVADMVTMLRDKQSGDWPVGRLGYIAALIAPERAAMIREIIAANRPSALAAYDQVVVAHRQGAGNAQER